MTTTNKISSIFLLLVLSALASSQDLVEPISQSNSGQGGTTDINCNGKITVCVGPLMYKDCVSNANGEMYASGSAKKCATNSRCVNDGVEICVPLKTSTDAPVTEAVTNVKQSAASSGPSTEGPLSTSGLVVSSTPISIDLLVVPVEGSSATGIPIASNDVVIETSYATNAPIETSDASVATTVFPNILTETTLLPKHTLESAIIPNEIFDGPVDLILPAEPTLSPADINVPINSTFLPVEPTFGTTEPNSPIILTSYPNALVDLTEPSFTFNSETTETKNPAVVLSSTIDPNIILEPNASVKLTYIQVDHPSLEGPTEILTTSIPTESTIVPVDPKDLTLETGPSNATGTSNSLFDSTAPIDWILEPVTTTDKISPTTITELTSAVIHPHSPAALTIINFPVNLTTIDPMAPVDFSFGPEHISSLIAVIPSNTPNDPIDANTPVDLNGIVNQNAIIDQLQPAGPTSDSITLNTQVNPSTPLYQTFGTMIPNAAVTSNQNSLHLNDTVSPIYGAIDSNVIVDPNASAVPKTPFDLNASLNTTTVDTNGPVYSNAPMNTNTQVNFTSGLVIPNAPSEYSSLADPTTKPVDPNSLLYSVATVTPNALIDNMSGQLDQNIPVGQHITLKDDSPAGLTTDPAVPNAPVTPDAAENGHPTVDSFALIDSTIDPAVSNAPLNFSALENHMSSSVDTIAPTKSNAASDPSTDPADANLLPSYDALLGSSSSSLGQSIPVDPNEPTNADSPVSLISETAVTDAPAILDTTESYHVTLISRAFVDPTIDPAGLSVPIVFGELENPFLSTIDPDIPIASYTQTSPNGLVDPPVTTDINILLDPDALINSSIDVVLPNVPVDPLQLDSYAPVNDTTGLPNATVAVYNIAPVEPAVPGDSNASVSVPVNQAGSNVPTGNNTQVTDKALGNPTYNLQDPNDPNVVVHFNAPVNSNILNTPVEPSSDTAIPNGPGNPIAPVDPNAAGYSTTVLADSNLEHNPNEPLNTNTAADTTSNISHLQAVSDSNGSTYPTTNSALTNAPVESNKQETPPTVIDRIIRPVSLSDAITMSNLSIDPNAHEDSTTIYNLTAAFVAPTYPNSPLNSNSPVDENAPLYAKPPGSLSEAPYNSNTPVNQNDPKVPVDSSFGIAVPKAEFDPNTFHIQNVLPNPDLVYANDPAAPLNPNSSVSANELTNPMDPVAPIAAMYPNTPVNSNLSTYTKVPVNSNIPVNSNDTVSHIALSEIADAIASRNTNDQLNSNATVYPKIPFVYSLPGYPYAPVDYSVSVHPNVQSNPNITSTQYSAVISKTQYNSNAEVKTNASLDFTPTSFDSNTAVNPTSPPDFIGPVDSYLSNSLVTSFAPVGSGTAIDHYAAVDSKTPTAPKALVVPSASINPNAPVNLNAPVDVNALGNSNTAVNSNVPVNHKSSSGQTGDTSEYPNAPVTLTVGPNIKSDSSSINPSELINSNKPINPNAAILPNTPIRSNAPVAHTTNSFDPNATEVSTTPTGSIYSSDKYSPDAFVNSYLPTVPGTTIGHNAIENPKAPNDAYTPVNSSGTIIPNKPASSFMPVDSNASANQSVPVYINLAVNHDETLNDSSNDPFHQNASGNLNVPIGSNVPIDSHVPVTSRTEVDSKGSVDLIARVNTNTTLNQTIAITPNAQENPNNPIYPNVSQNLNILNDLIAAVDSKPSVVASNAFVNPTPQANSHEPVNSNLPSHSNIPGNSNVELNQNAPVALSAQNDLNNLLSMNAALDENTPVVRNAPVQSNSTFYFTTPVYPNAPVNPNLPVDTNASADTPPSPNSPANSHGLDDPNASGNPNTPDIPRAPVNTIDEVNPIEPVSLDASGNPNRVIYQNAPVPDPPVDAKASSIPIDPNFPHRPSRPSLTGKHGYPNGYPSWSMLRIETQNNWPQHPTIKTEKPETIEIESTESKEPAKTKTISKENTSIEDKSKGKRKENEQRKKEEDEKKKKQEKDKREAEIQEEKKKEEEKKKKEEEKKKKEEDKRKKEQEKKKQEEELKENKNKDDLNNSKENSDEHKLKKKNRRELIENILKEIKMEKCSEDDIYPDVRDCKKYYRCVEKSDKTKFVHLHCEDDKHFDLNEKKCVNKNKAQCLLKDQ